MANVYCIPAGACRLLWAPLLPLAAAVNPAAVVVLRRALAGGGPPSADSPLCGLATELAVAVAPPAVADGPARPPFLGLILTRGCNLACRYCDFGSGTAGDPMSPELVSQAITGWVEWVRRAGGERLELHFFGGEPFTQPDLVEIAVHRSRCLGERYGLAVHVEATTNGLLGERMLAFVRDHFSALVLSLDGPAAEHDRQRPRRNGQGSFAEVWRTAAAVAESQVELCLRGCVSAANVEHLEDTALWLAETLRPASLTFEPLVPTPEATTAGLLPPEPLAFARHFLAARRRVAEVGVECVYSALSEQPRHTVCPVGRDTFIVAPDRSVRSCYLRRRDWEACGVDMRIGTVAATGALDIDPAAVQRLRRVTAGRARCERCFCRWSCAGGCLVTETPPGHGVAYTAYCRQTRLIQACTLLEQLGLAAQADRLLADPEAVARLWECPDDRLDRGDD